MLCDPVTPFAGCIGLQRKDSIETDEFVQAFRPKTCIKPSADEDVRYNNKFFFIKEKKHKPLFEASKIFQTTLAARNKL